MKIILKKNMFRFAMFVSMAFTIGMCTFFVGVVHTFFPHDAILASEMWNLTLSPMHTVSVLISVVGNVSALWFLIMLGWRVSPVYQKKVFEVFFWMVIGISLISALLFFVSLVVPLAPVVRFATLPFSNALLVAWFIYIMLVGYKVVGQKDEGFTPFEVISSRIGVFIPPDLSKR